MMGRFSVIPAYCLTDSRLTPRDLTVLSALGIYANKDGYAIPSLSTIGKILGITRQAVQKSIKHLSALNYLEVSTRTRGNSSQTSNQYRILFDAGCDEAFQRVPDFIADTLQPEVAGVQPTVAGGATSEVAGGATSEVAPRSLPPKSPSEQKKSGQSSLVDELPEWLDPEVWGQFVKMRQKMRKPLVELAIRRLVNKLEAMRKAGHNPNELLSTAIENGWLTVYEPRTNGKAQSTDYRDTDRPHYGKEFR